jgi:hypothetical protein
MFLQLFPSQDSGWPGRDNKTAPDGHKPPCGDGRALVKEMKGRKKGRSLPERLLAYWRRAVSVGEGGDITEEVKRDTAPGGGVGAATPAVCEPSPSFCKVNASNLPVGFRPWADWNLRMACAVSSSHLPLGMP